MKTRMRWIVLGAAAGAGFIGLSRRRNAEKAARWKEHMERAASRTALVTGASSGIGRAYTHMLAAQGYGLVLVARRKDRLDQLAASCAQQSGVKVEVLLADLSTEAGISGVEQRLARGDIDFLVNSAGYDVFGDFADMPIDKLLGLVQCLELATLRLTHAALPGMLVRRRGAVVNVSSVGAFGAKRKDAVYTASKAFVNRLTEALALELRGTGVRVQALCPGFTLTEFHDDLQYATYQIKKRVPRWLWMQPEPVVQESLRALGEDRVICVPGLSNRLVVGFLHLGLARFLFNLLGSFFPHALEAAKADASPVDLLACPECRGRLESTGVDGEQKLNCLACGKSYPMVEGIPRFAEYLTLSGLDRRFAGLYDWFSLFYRQFSKVAFAFIGTTEDAARFEIMEKVQPFGKVLEVSIGPGVNLPYLREYPAVREIYGLDLSNGQLAGCRRYARAKGWPVHLYQGNAECLPFQDNVFDSVFHVGGINFFNDKHKAITEMIRVAKPGAKIVISDETERGARGYEVTLPGFKKSFQGRREAVKPPVDLVPPEMEDTVLDESIWKGWFYILEFRKPVGRS